ncbi:MAG: hypothetical protein C0601_10395 [Candidatus Muiribacterium halophilum]|uniref:Uncharacterized protein n=1 Tax=Muiribacterium halophilum TaxID=2053465 RepID=A0A2N5ZCH8_MUIH1|nr:MAG: hypothetical protein C0601_10395 [Candidatus Muirbacterium halophilum]
MKKCVICGGNIEDQNENICGSTRCFVENELNKRKKLNRVKILHDTLRVKGSKVINLFPSRPWTSSCVDNLFENMMKKWTVQKTSKETKREEDEIKFMQNAIKRIGYENLKKVLVKIEKSKKDISVEKEWLRQVGLYNFFTFK